MNFIKSERADAEVIGHAILLGITIIGVGMITLYGVPTITGLQDMANVKNVEQTFTILDSRASRVMLGESPMQMININLGGGSLTIEPNSTDSKSYITVKSKNDTFNVTIPMGKVKYILGDRIIAYEGGGVWSKYPSGSVMLSPPEFHYNGVTLTLPVISINGNISVGGKGTASIFFKKNATIVQYPDTSCSGCTNRTNPVNSSEAGKVYVNITSDFYDAWADYAESLGYTVVGTNSTTGATDIELTVVPATLGDNTDIFNPIVFRGLDPGDHTPLMNFSFRVNTPVGGQKLNWDIRAKYGNKRLIFMLDEVAGDKVDIYVGYQHDGQGYTHPAETWEGKENFTIQADGYVDVDLLNKSINLTYKQLSGDVGTTNSQQGGCINSDKIQPADFNEIDFSWDDIIITDGNANKTQSLYNITQHYFWKMSQEGDISFGQCSPSGKGPAAGSKMLINYNATGALTYLHITENRADVSIS